MTVDTRVRLAVSCRMGLLGTVKRLPAVSTKPMRATEAKKSSL